VDNLAGIVFHSLKFRRKLPCTPAHGFTRLPSALAQLSPPLLCSPVPSPPPATSSPPSSYSGHELGVSFPDHLV
jgi:hypothetical protein